MSSQYFSEQVQSFKARIEQKMQEAVTESNIANPTLDSAMQYSLLLGGKRIRPFLVYATGQMFNVSLEQLDYAAIAMESIHTYSLIHDDLPAMDDDALRRGQPTCHIKFDEAHAILAGDCLQSFAFQTLSKASQKLLNSEQQLACIHSLATAANKMCAGQATDLQQTNNDIEHIQTLDSLQTMHELKTGALIEASVQMGAIIGNASKQEMELLNQYAKAIGLAFQVWDDVLDITSSSEVLGKPQGSDLEANKSTYPALLGLEGAQQKAQQLIEEAVHALNQLPYNTDLLKMLATFIIERDH